MPLQNSLYVYLVSKSRKKEVEEIEIYSCSGDTFPCTYMRFAQCMRSVRRYIVTYALRRNLTLIPLFRPSNSLALSSSHITKLPFDVKQSNRRLLHPFLPLFSVFFVYSLLHTRLLHLCHCGRWSF